jgi:hypothetical protein
MVWLALSSAGILHVERIRGKLDAEGYSNMVCGDACAHIHAAHGTDFTLQQDNAPPHRALLTQMTFEEAEIKSLPWSALSPDLNPVENTWAMIVRQLSADGKHYSNEEELWTAIQAACSTGEPRRVRAMMSVPLSLCRSFLSSSCYRFHSHPLFQSELLVRSFLLDVWFSLIEFLL